MSIRTYNFQLFIIYISEKSLYANVIVCFNSFFFSFNFNGSINCDNNINKLSKKKKNKINKTEVGFSLFYFTNNVLLSR